MRLTVWWGIPALVAVFFAAAPRLRAVGGDTYLRGDANHSGAIDISDAIYVLDFLFKGGARPLCPGLSDANAAQGTDISDVITILTYLFAGGVVLAPLSAQELEECEVAASVGRGERLFQAADPQGNRYSCGSCHEARPSASSGVRLPAHPLADVVRRPSFHNGQVDDLLSAVNLCRADWMAAPPWNAESSPFQELLAFLGALQPGAGPAPALTFRIVPPAASGPSAGDPVAGCETFARACESCHGRYGEGRDGFGPSLVARALPADRIREAIRLSGPSPESVPGTLYSGLLGNRMPFWSLERLSDAEVEDLAAYLVAAADPARRSCENAAPPRLLRSGRFQTRLHGVRGQVEHWSDRTIRLSNFYYDGQGPPDVLVWLFKKTGDFHDLLRGHAISGHIARSRPYVDESLTYSIPPHITDDMFNAVSIWCTAYSENYGDTLLR
jgi:thiosulfate dehydrogenase